MKRLLLILCLGLLSSACVSKRSADNMALQIDSLQQQVAAKEAVIDEVFASIGAITENLDAIKEREGLLTLATEETPDESQIQRMNRDIEVIDRLLADNRARIADLEQKAAQLKRANAKIKGLEKLITSLNGQVEEQRTEIAGLKSRVSTMQQEVARLNSEVEDKSREVTRLSEEKQGLEQRVEYTTNALNTIHYLVAPEKQLLNDQIISKRGFIGRTPLLSENPNLALFTEGDARLVKNLPIGERDAVLITPHPEESYWLVESETQKGVVESLTIIDSEKFWSLSKILVVSHK